jgi:hypothetical protein
MKAFYLLRHEDVSGVSGEGVVADGVVFDDGVTVIRWRSGRPQAQSTVVWDNVEDAIAIHGHDGKTELVYTVSDAV